MARETRTTAPGSRPDAEHARVGASCARREQVGEHGRPGRPIRFRRLCSQRDVPSGPTLRPLPAGRAGGRGVTHSVSEVTGRCRTR